VSTAVAALEDVYTDAHLLKGFLRFENIRIIWHQRLGHIHSRHVSGMRVYAIGTLSLPITTEIDSSSIAVRSAPRPSFTKSTSLPLLPAGLLNAIKVFLLPSDLSRAIFKR
jgi:hypothetical protein